MTEPDFEQMAGVCLAKFYEARSNDLIAENNVVAAALRQAWNARGAADITALEPILGVNMDHEFTAIKALDR